MESLPNVHSILDESNIKEFEFFTVTKDLNLQDGSIIKKGTEFMIESYDNNGICSLHFSQEKDNHYTKECGQDYSFSIYEIKEFAEPTKLSFEDYLNKLNYVKTVSIIENDNVISKGVSNKLNISNEKVLDKVEKIIEGINNIKLKIRPLHGELNFKHLNNINKFLYGNLYKLPDVSKDKIDNCKNILKDIKKEKISKVKNIDEFVDKTTKHISKLYNLNLFEKGNTATIKEFTRNLGMSAGFNLDLSRIANDKFEHGCLKAKDNNFENLNKLIKYSSQNVDPMKEIIRSFERLIGIGMER